MSLRQCWRWRDEISQLELAGICFIYWVADCWGGVVSSYKWKTTSVSRETFNFMKKREINRLVRKVASIHRKAKRGDSMDKWIAMVVIGGIAAQMSAIATQTYHNKPYRYSTIGAGGAML